MTLAKNSNRMKQDKLPKELLEWANGVYRQHAQKDGLSEKECSKIVEQYFGMFGLNIQKIKEGSSKTPDYLLEETNQRDLLIEIKSPLMIKDPETNLYPHKKTLPRLRRHIKSASEQFISFDKEHKRLRILVFTSTHFQQNWHTLAECIQGFVGTKGYVTRDLRKHGAILGTNHSIQQIDAFIWLQINKDDRRIYEDTIFINGLVSDKRFDILKSSRKVTFKEVN